MIRLWWLSLLPLTAYASLDKTYGVSPSLISRYVPLKSGTWKCLDGSKEISWEFVNDDSCDCPDGSDEPGTSACVNGTFFCKNAGHIGASIPSSRVKDGLCEPECCDGSDERPGVCPNICKTVGEAHKKKVAEQRKMQKTGAKIRSSYIAFARKEKTRLEAVIQQYKQDITAKEKHVERLRDVAERSESLSAAALEHKQQSPLYLSLIDHSNALKSLQREYKKHLEREKALGDILDALRAGYNPNYQDMAVLEAVRGWEFLAGLPAINERDRSEDVDEEGSDDNEKPAEAQSEAVEEKKEEQQEGDLWTAEQLENDLDSLLETDYVTLLLAHEEHTNSPEGSILFDITSYLPDSFIPQYEDFKDVLLSWLQKLGIVRAEGGVSAGTSKVHTKMASDHLESARARQAFQDAQHELTRMKDDLQKSQKQLDRLFSTAKDGFGSEGEWKKLDGTCLEKDTGEYTYEVCLFGEAKQKPNKGGSTFSLGKFSSWNPSADVKPGSSEYYQKQVYNRGAKCWNGPERSVILVMNCGTENAIHSVIELEKCEYQFTGTSSALCLPLDADTDREEL